MNLYNQNEEYKKNVQRTNLGAVDPKMDLIQMQWKIENFKFMLHEQRQIYLDMNTKMVNNQHENQKAYLDMERVKNEEKKLKQDLTEIHENYISSAAYADQIIDSELKLKKKIAKLNRETDELKLTFLKMQEKVNEHNETLQKIEKMITAYEKKIAALSRRLYKISLQTNIPTHLKDKIDCKLRMLTSDDKENIIMLKEIKNE